MAAAAAVLASEDLAALIAWHLHDVVDVRGEANAGEANAGEADAGEADAGEADSAGEAGVIPRLPVLLGVARAPRAGTQRALREVGYATVLAGALAYVLVPHAPAAWTWDAEDGRARPARVELPLAWRVRLRHAGAAGGVGHVHPCDALWAGVLEAPPADVGARRWRAVRAAAADALRYALADADATTPDEFCRLLRDDLELDGAADLAAFVASHVAPLAPLLAHARRARAACAAASRRRGAARLGVVLTPRP